MAKVTLKGNPVNLSGELPAVGSTAPDFALVAADLSEKSLKDFAGKKKILTINPSYDTGTCAAAARQFNKAATKHGDAVVLVISGDLPFAQKRFCEAEGLSNVVTLSAFRSSFAKDYGIEIQDGPLKALTARSVVVLDENNKVLKTQLVPEITQEPDYADIEAALS